MICSYFHLFYRFKLFSRYHILLRDIYLLYLLFAIYVWIIFFRLLYISKQLISHISLCSYFMHTHPYSFTRSPISIFTLYFFVWVFAKFYSFLFNVCDIKRARFINMYFLRLYHDSSSREPMRLSSLTFIIFELVLSSLLFLAGSQKEKLDISSLGTCIIFLHSLHYRPNTVFWINRV